MGELVDNKFKEIYIRRGFLWLQSYILETREGWLSERENLYLMLCYIL